jgi:hypothetical protein
MQRAAGVSSVQLICHADTWRTLDSFWSGTVFPKVPKDRVVSRDNMVEVTLSGVQLTALLNLTHDNHSTYVSQAVAARTYEQVAKVIDAVDPDTKPGQPIPAIVLDDKLGEKSASSS